MAFQSTKNLLRSVRKYVAGLLLAVSVLSCSPHSAYAKADDEDDHYDARIQGYDSPNVELKTWGAGGCWMMLVLMSVACVGVIFKDAKRSHLD